MTVVVPYDGSELARAALVRAAEFGTVFDEDVLAVTVIPRGNTEYASERDWIGPNESFDRDSIVSNLREEVDEVAPDGQFRGEFVDRYARSGTIANRVRQIARENDASMLFIGSENAGHMVTSLSSVGSGIAADGEYNVVIVRHRGPTRIDKLEAANPER